MYEFLQMRPDVKDAWVTALRSGDYKQGRKVLARKTEDGLQYCCLGVLCDLAIKAGVEISVGEGFSYSQGETIPAVSFDESTMLPPEAVLAWAGIPSHQFNPVIDVTADGEGVAAAVYNDGGEGQEGRNLIQPHTFEQIAEMIERNL